MVRKSLLFTVIAVFLSAAVPSFAFTTVLTSNASQNTVAGRGTMEPVISVQSINGVTHGAVAYIDIPNPVTAPSASRIEVAHTFDFVNWSGPIPLRLDATNGITYQYSADPVFIEYGPNLPFYTNWLFCFGTMWTNTDHHGRSTIGAWYSTDGGQTWSQPVALDAPPYDPSCEGAGTCVFDDKPAAALSPNGVIYITFTRTSATNVVCMSELLGSRGWISVGPILTNKTFGNFPGPTPVVNPSDGRLYLFTMNRTNNNEEIWVFSSGDGWTFDELTKATASGFGLNHVNVGTSHTPVEAIPFLAAKVDPFQSIIVVYHRQEAGTEGPQVVLRRFCPQCAPEYAWTPAAPINPNGHSQWNPALTSLSNGNMVITYYDTSSADPGYTLYASKRNIYGGIDETSRIFTTSFSDPTGYNLGVNGSRIGEYQGLTVLNDTLYAATLYIPQTTPQVGNAWLVKFTTP